MQWFIEDPLSIHSETTAQPGYFLSCLLFSMCGLSADLITTLDSGVGFISSCIKNWRLCLMRAGRDGAQYTCIMNAAAFIFKTVPMLLEKLLNSGSSGSNQFLLKPPPALTYLFLGWSHGLFTTISLLRRFRCHRFTAAEALFWANTQRGHLTIASSRRLIPELQPRTTRHGRLSVYKSNSKSPHINYL